MFERFSHEARHVVVRAQDEARERRHNYIGTEHILLSLMAQEGVAAHVLDLLRVSDGQVREQVESIVGHGDEPVHGQIPFTPRAKKVLELALREALSLGHNYIGSGHLLLAIVRADDGVAARILRNLGAEPRAVRAEIKAALAGASSSAEWQWRQLSRRIDRIEAQPKLGAATLAMSVDQLVEAFSTAQEGRSALSTSMPARKRRTPCAN